MKKILFFGLIVLFSCKNEKKTKVVSNGLNLATEDYELNKVKDSKALLIVFPGGGSSAKETKRDFKILEKAAENNISVLLMNYSGKLWLNQQDEAELSKKIHHIVKKHILNSSNIFIGGMSIGGTVAITIADYLKENSSTLKPKGVFVVDSPIDLLALYKSSKKDLLRKDFSEERLGEPRWIVSYFEKEFGEKSSFITNIQKVSPFTLQTENINNIKNLKDVRLRFYTEPDTLWLMTNRQTDFESSNAFTIQQTDNLLNRKNWKNSELIQTINKGYRFNGERNPHSWSIVDVDELVNWILK